MLIPLLCGVVVFLFGLCAALLVERGAGQFRARRAEKDALSLACESEERLAQNTRLLAELGRRPTLDLAEMRLKAPLN